MATVVTEALVDIGIERKRQISDEGFMPEDDNILSGGVLARMGACYARHAANYRGQAPYPPPLSMYSAEDADEDWPGPREFWKPSDPRRDLVKAAALIVAEIERMDRGIA